MILATPTECGTVTQENIFLITKLLSLSTAIIVYTLVRLSVRKDDIEE